jgi:NAD(P)-dependent dehydrogenase (short-subunit alcohol dehydrogenase family)
LLLAARGAKVLVNDRGGDMNGLGADSGVAQAVVDEIRAAGGEAEANGETVATTAGANAIAAQALERWGKVDILVNNAGLVVTNTSLAGVSDENYDTDMGVAAGGTFRLCRAVWAQMVERDYGRIVNVSSSSVFGLGSGVPYPAAKGAVLGMSRSLAAGARNYNRNIKVNAIMPVAASRMSVMMGEETAQQMQTIFPPSAVAPIVALLAHEDAPCNGETFDVGGGRFGRVFFGITDGYRGSVDQTLEDVRDHFNEAMDMSHFTVVIDGYDNAMMYQNDIDWSLLRQID